MSQYFLSLPHHSEVVDAADEGGAIARAEQATTALRTRVEVRALQVPPEQ